MIWNVTNSIDSIHNPSEPQPCVKSNFISTRAYICTSMLLW